MSDAEILPFPSLAAGEERTAIQMEHVRMAEAILFASAEPVREKALAERLGKGADVSAVLDELQRFYALRGVNLVRLGDAWAFRTASDLSFLLQREAVETRRLGKAALEVLAIIAYHQPATRAEIEEVRGVATAKGTLDTLMEVDFVRMRGRRRTPGRPVTYGTTPFFLDHFGLPSLSDLPGLEELRGAGLLQSDMPMHFAVPTPPGEDVGVEDEDPFTPEDLEELGILPPSGDGSEPQA